MFTKTLNWVEWRECWDGFNRDNNSNTTTFDHTRTHTHLYIYQYSCHAYCSLISSLLYARPHIKYKLKSHWLIPVKKCQLNCYHWDKVTYIGIHQMMYVIHRLSNIYKKVKSPRTWLQSRIYIYKHVQWAYKKSQVHLRPHEASYGNSVGWLDKLFCMWLLPIHTTGDNWQFRNLILHNWWCNFGCIIILFYFIYTTSSIH